jgi:hypothetical protein
MHPIMPRRLLPALRLSFIALLAATSAWAFPPGQDLYVQPSSQPFVENPGETVVALSVSSGSIADAQSQLDAARAANPSAIIVLTLSGNYAVSTAPLSLPSHTCLVLAAGATIQAAPGATATALIRVAGQTNVSIAGGTLNGNGASLNAIQVTTSNRVNIDKVVVQNCGLDGISLTGNGNAVFDNEMAVSRCEVSGCGGNGISAASGTQFVCVDSFCRANGAAGIFLATARSTVVNNRCIGNATGIVGHGNDSVITDNTVDGNPTGISLDASSNNNVCSSNAINNSTVVGLSDAGVNDTIFQNVFTGNAANFSGTGTGTNVVAWRGSLNAPGLNYFYPPLIDDQHSAPIMNGKGRFDLTIGAATVDSVQTQYNAALAAHPNDVIVLHLTSASYAVGAAPLTLSSNTCVLLNGTIQIGAATSAGSGIRGDGLAFISISGGTVDGGGRTGKNAVYISNSRMVWVDKMTLGNLGPSNPRVGGSDVVHFSGGSTPYLFSRNLVSGGAARGVWSQLSSQKSIYTDNECRNVNQDGIDLDSNTYSGLVKFNYCHDNVRYGIFFEQRAPYNQAIGNLVMRNGRGINVYNNAVTPETRYNSVICNLCDSNSNALRSGSVDAVTSHNFFFNNRAINSSGIGIEGDPTGTENYYSQNIATGNGTNIRTSGSETFFNPAVPALITAAPAFTPAGGSYVGPQSVTITSGTPGAAIRYTTDGSTPTSTVGTLYAGPVAVSGSTTLKAIAYTAGSADSDVVTAIYTIQVAPPVFSLPSGTYSGAQSVTISTASSGASIRYTTDGSTPTSTAGTLYSGPVTIAASSTLKAIAYASGQPDSTVTSASYVITSDPPVATPVFSPAGGTYTTVQSVTISSATSGASIRYTLDGSTPSPTVGTLYSGPVSIGSSTTLKAIAYAAGLQNSAIASSVYTINLPSAAAPTFTPAPGTYTTTQSVAMTTTTAGASIRYTTDGSTPSATVGTVYSGPVSVSATTTLNAVAFGSGLATSPVTSGVYTIAGTVAAPVITPNGGSYDDPQVVTLSTATSGASIRYMTNGGTPTSTSGTLYSAPFTISSTSTVNAIAFKTGLTTSPVSSSYFAIGLSFEAENLQFTPTDGTASISVETTASGGAFASDYQYVTLGAPGVGTYIEFILQDIPAGTYNLQMRYKSHPTNRGTLQMYVDDVPLGTTLDQRASTATFSTKDFGVVRFGSFGDHVVRLVVIGKNAASTLYNLTADRFDLIPDKTAPTFTAPASQTLEATSPAGAPATFAATANDDKDGPVPVTFSPVSGSTFPLGTTTVTATAADFAGNTTTKTFTVTVRDTTAPVLTVPADLTLEATGPSGAVATFAATATDAVGATVSYSQASGSVFPLGSTTVNVTAIDAAGNTATGSFSVTVRDTTPPAIATPANLTAEATSAAGAVVSFTTSAADLVSGASPVTAVPASGSTFPLGTTLVTLTSSDAAGNLGSSTFNVTVRDTTAPVLTLPPSQTIEATGPGGAAAVFTAGASDLVSGDVPVSFDVGSGSTFPLGTTTVTASATDAAGNTATGSFTITVVDATPPALTLPADLVVEAAGPDGAAAMFEASAHDIVSGEVAVTFSVASGSIFPLGATTVSVQATDAAGNTATGSFKVTVVDTTPPALTLPADLTVEATSPSGAYVSFSATAHDAVSGDRPVFFSPVAGTLFGFGTTAVTATATDAAGNTATGTFHVTVHDSTAPVIQSLSASQTVLSVPNHKMIPIVISAVVVDHGDAAPVTKIISVSSNEPVNGSGDGDTAPDWEITGNLTLNLRAERAGNGTGRIYTIVVQSRDAFGNASTRSVQVAVPH